LAQSQVQLDSQRSAAAAAAAAGVAAAESLAEVASRHKQCRRATPRGMNK